MSRNLFPDFKSAQFYAPTLAQEFGSGTYTMTANRLLCAFVLFPKRFILKQLVANWAGTGANFVMGVYSDSAGKPGDKVVATSSTPSASGSVVSSVSTTLEAGMYWLVVHSDGGASMQDAYVGNPIFVVEDAGAKTAAGVHYYNDTLTFDGTLPASLSGYTWTISATTTMPAMAFLGVSK